MRESLRVVATGAIVLLLAACGGIGQDDFKASLALYITAAGTNFAGFNGDPALVGTSGCGVKNAGTSSAIAECKLGDGFDKLVDAMKTYNAQKDRVTKALPSDARSREEIEAYPDTPFRFAAVSGKGAMVLVLTKSNGKWVVGYVFRKAP